MVQDAACTGHSGSVEGVAWSPEEAEVLASCSVDKTVCIWDVRAPQHAMRAVRVADTDVNAVAWNPKVRSMLATGHDDGSFKVWDMRAWEEDKPVAHFRYHRGPVYAIEWDPYDENCLVVVGGDNQITYWDLSLEPEEDEDGGSGAAGDDGEDEEERSGAAGGAGGGGRRGGRREPEMPPQLLFSHHGQVDPKEAHFHRQQPGVIVSAGANGLNFFKPDVRIAT